MIRVVQIIGGVGILGVHILFLILLHPRLPPASATPNGLSDEESKSLWHVMAQSMLAVDQTDRDRFLDLCLKRRVLCDAARFQPPGQDFHWRPGITPPIKDRFWHAYTCVYNSNLTQCPVDGEWSSWSPWSRCSATCDAKGTQNRSRTCNNPVPVRGGEQCFGSTMRSRPCLGSCENTKEHGGVAGAEAFLKQVHEAYPSLMHDCYNAHCTYGVVQRVITEKHVRAKYWSTLSCVKYGGACPVDGQWSQWSAWSRCSLKCGSGSRTRVRTCDSPQPAFAGHPCKGEFHEQQSCIMRECGAASTETFTEWTKWTPCSVSCGGFGLQKATRVCLRHIGCDLLGVLTPYVNRTRPCYAGDCPTQGGWSEWSEWTDCSAACGDGRQSRLRLCDSPFPAGGLDCFGDTVDFRLCKGDSCVGQLNLLEKTGFQRPKDVKEENVLISKSDEYSDGPLDPNLESLYTPWAPWTLCSATCGQGMRIRKRGCSAQTTPMPPCEGEVRQIQFCNIFVCPVLGGWGVWLPWTPCSKTCGPGKKQRYRECNNPLPQFGGSCLGDSQKVEDCDTASCPSMVGGTWSTWSPWSTCTVTCGGGERSRKRARQRFSGGASPSQHSVKNPPFGTQEVLDCNAQPCPVDGSWAEWGEWSRCSVPCGLGRRIRDRACTDPSPLFGGHICSGPGTDLAHCFAGPCKDSEDRAVHLSTTSWIRFAPHNRPSRFLVIYLHFKPVSPVGSILRRYRQCRNVFDEDENDNEKKILADADEKKNDDEDRRADEDDKCQLVVDLGLEQAEPKLSVMARGARLDIHSPVALNLGSWHEILVEILKSGASLRVNNHERLFSNFSRPLIKDLDFDSFMVLGANDNKTVGLMCSISSLSVNFRTQDLFSSQDWVGQGTPVGRHAVSVLSINPSVQLPHFHGLYYCPVRLYHTARLTVRMTLALDGGEGLLLYARGQVESTLMSLGFKHSRMVMCMVCSRSTGNVCHQGDLLRLHQWYHVVLRVEDTEAELRMDNGKALQLTCKGLPFKPRKVLFVGGRSAAAWNNVKKTTNYTIGFYGVLGTLVVNGKSIPFRHAVLMGRDDRINLDGYSRTTRITPVFEHKTSIVMLHCEVEQPADLSTEIKVIWLLRDTVLEPSELVEIVKPVGLTRRVGTLQLKPGGHNEGIYACVVSRDGRLELNHVFPVFRHVTREDIYGGNVEWVFLKLLLILIPLLAVCCILYKFRDWFIEQWQKRFGGKEAEKEPLLPIEPLDVLKPDKPHLQGSDDHSNWCNYLPQKKGSMVKTKVVSFGPPQSRQLSLTPGVSSDRHLQVSDCGQVKLGENLRLTSTVQPEAPSLALPPSGWDQYSGTDINSAAKASENKGEDPVYANMTYNKPTLITCRQQQPLIYNPDSVYTSKRTRKVTGTEGRLADRARRRSIYPETSNPKPSKLRRKSSSGERPQYTKDTSVHVSSGRPGVTKRRAYSEDRQCQGYGFNQQCRFSCAALNPVRGQTGHPHLRTSYGRSRSEDRGGSSPDPEAVSRSNIFQQARVRFPEPVVFSRHRDNDVGNAGQYRSSSAGRNSFHPYRARDTNSDIKTRKSSRDDTRERRYPKHSVMW